VEEVEEVVVLVQNANLLIQMRVVLHPEIQVEVVWVITMVQVVIVVVEEKESPTAVVEVD